MPILKCAEPVDPQWSKTLMEMDRDAKLVSLSSVEMQFLENVTLLEEMKEIITGCEVLEEYKLISSQEGFELWEKIKNFFVELWKKFIEWLKGVPNWFRPYINRIKDIKSRLGVTIEMNPLPQSFLLPNPIEFHQKMVLILGTGNSAPMTIGKINNVPTLCFGNGAPVKDSLKEMQFNPTQLDTEMDYIAYCESIIQFEEYVHDYQENLSGVFFDDFDEWAKSVDDLKAQTDAVKAFQEDLGSVMKIYNQIIMIAKNLSAVKVSAIKR